MNKIPLTEVSTELLAEMRERVWLYTASIFAIDGSMARYTGTATCVAASKAEYLLTAAHVWHELRGDRFGLALEEDRLLVPSRDSMVGRVVLSASGFAWRVPQ